MILVVGGIASGKRTYVRSLGYVQGDFDRNPQSNTPVLCELEELLRSGPLSDSAFEAIASKEVVICNEVGLGVVPFDTRDRAWRERVGRTCALLAERAEQVVRLVCGIPVHLKDSYIERH